MIVVFGSLILDLLFSVARLPRSGETALGPGYLTAPGGKGANQAIAAARDGAQVAMFGAIGRDAFAQPVMAGLRANGVDVSGVMACDAPTGCAAIGVDNQGDNQIMVAAGANAYATAAQVPDALLDRNTILLVQMEMDRAQTEKLIARAAARGCRVMLNLAPALPIALEALHAVDWVLVNEIEAEVLAGQSGAANASANALAMTLGTTAICTYGERGAAASDGHNLWQVPALAVAVADSTGAGDAFAGVLAGALDAGVGMEAALRRAAVAGSLSCTAKGAQSALPDRAAIDQALTRLA